MLIGWSLSISNEQSWATLFLMLFFRNDDDVMAPTSLTATQIEWFAITRVWDNIHIVAEFCVRWTDVAGICTLMRNRLPTLEVILDSRHSFHTSRTLGPRPASILEEDLDCPLQTIRIIPVQPEKKHRKHNKNHELFIGQTTVAKSC